MSRTKFLLLSFQGGAIGFEIIKTRAMRAAYTTAAAPISRAGGPGDSRFDTRERLFHNTRT